MNQKNGKTKVGSIALNPSWKCAARIYMEVLENGEDHAKQNAREGIMEMAEKLDAFVSAQNNDAA